MKEIDLEKLFEIAGNRALALEAELNVFAKLLLKNFELRVFFENITNSKKDKLKLIAKVMPGSSGLFTGLIELLIDENLEKRFIKLYEGFVKIVSRKTGVVFADVATAYPLTDSDRKKIETWLAGKVKIREEIDPSLIGGIRIKASDGRYFDGSLSGALKNLKERMVNV